MAILVVIEAHGMTVEQYRNVNARLGIRGDDDAPDGLISHVAGRTDDGVLVVDVWESQEKLDRFFRAEVGPAFEAEGVETGPPTVLPVHNLIPKGAGTTAGTLVLIDVDGFGPEAYDTMTGQMDAHVADGTNHPAVSHVAAAKDGGMLVVDVWESPEAFGRFAETEVATAGASIGLGPIEPRFVPIVNRIRGPKAR